MCTVTFLSQLPLHSSFLTTKYEVISCTLIRDEELWAKSMTLVKVELFCYAGVCQSNGGALKHGHLLGRGTKDVSYFPVCLFFSLVLCLINTCACAHMTTSAPLHLFPLTQTSLSILPSHSFSSLFKGLSPLIPSLRESETFILLFICDSTKDGSHKHLHFFYLCLSIHVWFHWRSLFSTASVIS